MQSGPAVVACRLETALHDIVWYGGIEREGRPIEKLVSRKNLSLFIKRDVEPTQSSLEPFTVKAESSFYTRKILLSGIYPFRTEGSPRMINYLPTLLSDSYKSNISPVNSELNN